MKCIRRESDATQPCAEQCQGCSFMESMGLPATGVLPCPFCGATPNLSDPRTFHASQGEKWGAVMCCGSGPEVRTDYMPVEHWRDKAIAAWNERVPTGRYVPETTGALRKLMKESAAILALCEPQLRGVAGHTNVNVFKLRIEQAGDLLGRISRQSIEDRLHVSQQMDEEAGDGLAERQD